MHSTRESLSTRLLRRLAGAICHYPKAFLYPQVILSVLCVWYTVARLEFTTNRSDLVGADKKYHRDFQNFQKEFHASEEMVAVVESGDFSKNRRFVERLGARMAAETNLFVDVIYNNDVKMLGNKALLFFPEEDLKALYQTLRDYAPFIRSFAKATNINELFRLVNQQFRTAKREENPENESLVKALPALERIVREANDSLERPGQATSPGLYALFNAGHEVEKQIYITFDNGRMYLVSARAASPAVQNDAVRRLRELVREIQDEVPGVNAEITGQPVLEFDEMVQSQRDTTLATVVSLILVALIFIYGYSETGRPIKATLCLIVGLAYTMGFTTLVVGHLNILTITFVPMLIGLAIDFGVHLITRYEEELRNGRTEREAIEKAVVFTGLGIFTGCFTTAGAFLAMGLTDFRGIQEMGIISGGGLLLCLVPMMTLLPVLLLRGRQNVLDHGLPHEVEKRARIERLWLERPMLVGAVTLALCGVALARFDRVHFDYNLLNMQTRGLPAVVFERKLISSAEKSALFCMMVAPSLEEAARLEARVTNLSSVASVQSMTRFLVEDQTEKLSLIGEVKKQVAPISFGAPDSGRVNVPEFSRTLYSLQGYLGLAADEVAREDNPELLRQLRSLRDSIDPFRKRMLADPEQAAIRLADFQRALFGDIHSTFTALRDQDDRDRLRASDLPPALRHRFISKSGNKYLIQVYPKEDVWQRSHQEEFVRQLRTVDPDVTGPPVQLLEYTTLLKESYQTAAWYALGAISLLIFVQFRSLTCVVLSLLPVAVGMIWMVGFMGWFNIPFNPANIMTLPLVIGIGVTNGIHILNRFAEEQNPSILAKSTGKAVLVSALTTIVGFGSLVLAKHQGIASLGAIMAVGTATCMIAALTFLPAVLNFLIHHGWRLKRPSDDNAQPSPGREEPR